MAKDKQKLTLKTGMLSFARSLQLSEGLFSATRSADAAWRQPIEVFEKGVRGQKSQYNADVPGDSNLQIVDAAVVPLGCDGVVLEFSMLVAPNSIEPWASDNSEVYRAYQALVQAYAEKGGFNHLARLYVWNIANARFAWRNRYQSDEMNVRVEFNGKEIVFNPIELSLKCPASNEELSNALISGKTASAKIGFVEELVAWMEAGLRQKQVWVKVSWRAKMMEGQEIFPSQEFVRDQIKSKNDSKGEDKDKDERGGVKKEGHKSNPYKKSRFYAKLPRYYQGGLLNQASMHSQKIGAALRHIDKWHDEGERVIAVNPYGGVQETGEVFRDEKSKKDFYSLRNKADALISNIEDAQDAAAISGDVHFVIANLVRGGVFGQSGK